jgi:dienelactone hydrolase
MTFRKALPRIGIVAAAMAVVAFSASAAGYRLAPYKDDLFDYPGVIETGYGGDFVRVDYSEKRDLDERDTVPEKQARPEYVSLETKAVERDLTLDAGRSTLKYIATGKIDGGAKAIVLYVHGRNGNRFQGANDGMFGGNFNRIKNLMMRNDGLYLSPGFPDLKNKGRDAAKALLKEYAAKSPGAAIFVACGSLGGGICWRLIEDPEVAPMLSGLLLLGSTNDNRFFKSPPATGAAPPVPIYIGHGTRDPIIKAKSQLAFFKSIRERVPGYPVKLALFESGAHGTPIRMTDWRLVLNWMLEVDGK